MVDAAPEGSTRARTFFEAINALDRRYSPLSSGKSNRVNDTPGSVPATLGCVQVNNKTYLYGSFLMERLIHPH